mmetsp:Transcript_12226/g.19365  ORF Transcript_12226/g.19365 Transcript_12226/m.19365 type:complete len:105 (+) Transcript_12226:1473-1787(+)
MRDGVRAMTLATSKSAAHRAPAYHRRNLLTPHVRVRSRQVGRAEAAGGTRRGMGVRKGKGLQQRDWPLNRAVVFLHEVRRHRGWRWSSRMVERLRFNSCEISFF